jgi:hypothetical protein
LATLVGIVTKRIFTNLARISSKFYVW